MNEKTFRLLEFDAVKAAAASFSLSDEAARRIREETPRADAEAAASLRSLALAVFERLAAGEGERRDSLPQAGAALQVLETQGAALDAEAALALGLFVERGTALKEWLAKQDGAVNGAERGGEGDGGLRALLSGIPDCSGAAREIFAVIDREGNFRDLPALREIKRRVQRLKDELDHAADPYRENEEKRHMLQSAVPSQRDGRVVLAVKANFRGRFRGIVREVSASGQTVFVEPEEVVEKNNELVIERRRLDAEIRRVMRELTRRLAVRREALGEFHEKVVFLETLRAKARYGLETQSRFAASGPFSLKRARHPLLGEAAVPLDIAMETGGPVEIRAVIITGPNTGGKTVALKTAGLFALMNQCGLPVPAAQGTTLPFFDGVFADIGDEQSLSQSLSTFSGHIANITGIIASATERSLVLLDELGSGTDPEEGSALAMAVLDTLLEKKARLLVTTHHGILKNYGAMRPGVENASMEFDSGSLRPTYRVIMGIPGESRALEAAERNGLPREVAAKARSYLAGERASLSTLIAGLREKRREMDEAAKADEAERLRLIEAGRAAEERELRLRQKEISLRREGLGEMNGFLRQARRQLENLVRELREGEVTREKALKVKAFLSGLAEKTAGEAALLEREEAALAEALRGPASAAAREPAPLIPGAEVFAALSGEEPRRGRLLRPDRKAAGEPAWLVEIGALRMSVPESALTPAPPSASGILKPPPPSALVAAPGLTARAELNLVGMRLEEARAALERQLDAAVLAGLGSFAVIHGKGEGVLRRGVHDCLRASPFVADFRFSRPELGGFGRTEVVLKTETG